MEEIKHRTKIDWWIALILFVVGVIVPLIFVLGIFLNWFESGETIGIAISAGSMFLIIIIMFILSYIATYYRLDDQGLIVRNTFFFTRTVPYNKIISVKESINIINRPRTWAAPLSCVGIRINYVNEAGAESWFFIAPRNRQIFMQQLQSKINSSSL